MPLNILGLFPYLYKIQPWKQMIQICEEGQMLVFYFFFSGGWHFNKLFVLIGKRKSWTFQNPTFILLGSFKWKKSFMDGQWNLIHNLGSQLSHELNRSFSSPCSHTFSSAMTNLFKICQKVNLIWTNDNQ